MGRKKIVVVILNYLNYLDTIQCVNSIMKHNYSLEGIVIVDNGSQNDSFAKLEEEYQQVKGIHLIALRKNRGFAKGNNAGINYARKVLRADFVFCANNDTIFLDEFFFDRILDAYKPGIGMIGTEILNPYNEIQEIPMLSLDVKSTFFRWLNYYSIVRGTEFGLPVDQVNVHRFLHGCAFMFTPDFFRFYKGFYRRTFLYLEEPILYLMCMNKGLKQVYVNGASILHLEDRSSEMSFGNASEVKTKYLLDSLKYLIYWEIKSRVYIRMDMEGLIKMEKKG